MKMKRLFVILGCLVILICSCLPAFASSYQDPETGTVRRYWAQIPLTTMTITNGIQSFTFDAMGNYLDKVISSYDAPYWGLRDPAYSPITYEQVGWQGGGASPIVTYLSYEYEQQYYSQSSQFYTSYNMFRNFQLDGLDMTGSTIFSMVGKTFQAVPGRWNQMRPYTYLYVEDAVSVSTRFTVDYCVKDATTGRLTRYNRTLQDRLSSTGPDQLVYLPSFADLFPAYNADTAINGGVIVYSITMEFVFNICPSRVGFGMAYHSIDPQAANLLAYTIPGDEVIVEVPVTPDNLDPVSWLAGPIQKFFAVEFFPGFSIGKVALVMFTFMLVGVIFFFLKR